MGEVRYREMLNVAKVLDLSSMTVLDLPDSGLKEMDPRAIEAAIQSHIEEIQPDIVLTYAVHGISGFHDHLVSHAVVKRLFLAMHDAGADYLKRLAFVTITEEIAKEKSKLFHLSGSTAAEIDCIIEVDQEDLERNLRALDCYVTFQETIERSGIKDAISRRAVFEIFQEDFSEPLTDLTDQLP